MPLTSQRFRFEGVEYSITIEEVAVFPQGYAALMTETGLLQDEPSMYIRKQWKKPGTKVTNLRKLGIPADKAYQWGNSRLGYWRIAGSLDLKCSITNERLAAAGYFSILNYYESLHLCS